MGQTAGAVAVQDVVSERTRDLLERRRFGKSRRRGWLIRRALATADLVGLTLAFLLAQLLFETNVSTEYDTILPSVEYVTFFLSLPLWLLLARAYGLYDRDEARTDHSSVDDLFALFNMLTVGTWIFYGITSVTQVANPSLPKLLFFWASAIVCVAATRGTVRTACRKYDSYIQNTVIVGAGHVGQSVARKLLKHQEYGVNVVGFVDAHPREPHSDLEHLSILGSIEDLPEIVAQLDVERVIIAFSHLSHETALDTIRELNGLDVQVDVVPRLFEVLGPTTTIHGAEGIPLLGLPATRLSWSSVVLKRGMDVVLSGLALVLLSPLLALIALAIKLDTRGPVLFRQIRIGTLGRPFIILKFRTMVTDAERRKHEIAHLNKHKVGDARMFKAVGDPRVTRVGHVLRRFSLDELPQLVNVLRGDMSLVGARPLIPEEDRYVAGWATRRLDLKPGLTGLWQVLGRDDIPFGEMVGLDYRYVTTWSIMGDLKLMLRTLAVMRRSGA